MAWDFQQLIDTSDNAWHVAVTYPVPDGYGLTCFLVVTCVRHTGLEVDSYEFVFKARKVVAGPLVTVGIEHEEILDQDDILRDIRVTPGATFFTIDVKGSAAPQVDHWRVCGLIVLAGA